jgi:hypothetical protein
VLPLLSGGQGGPRILELNAQWRGLLPEDRFCCETGSLPSWLVGYCPGRWVCGLAWWTGAGAGAGVAEP